MPVVARSKPERAPAAPLEASKIFRQPHWNDVRCLCSYHYITRRIGERLHHPALLGLGWTHEELPNGSPGGSPRQRSVDVRGMLLQLIFYRRCSTHEAKYTCRKTPRDAPAGGRKERGAATLYLIERLCIFHPLWVVFSLPGFTRPSCHQG